MPVITANYLVYLAEAKKLGARRTEAEKEVLRQELRNSLLAALAADLGLENRRGGKEVKELVLRGRAFFNQEEYLKNFSEGRRAPRAVEGTQPARARNKKRTGFDRGEKLVSLPAIN